MVRGLSSSLGGSDAHYDVVVIGAGQAGLAVGYFLAREGRRFVILDGGDAVGSAWRDRWDSLTLFTPRRYDSLPGLAFPGQPDGYPARDEVVSYLQRYAATFELPIELGTTARSLTRDNGTFVLGLDDAVLRAEQVVVATGPFQTPRVPPIANGLGAEVDQLHSSEYRSPEAIARGQVLIVGGGNTGFQIAEELAASHEVHLSIGSRQTPLPQRILGHDLFWYLERTGLMRKTTASRIGRRLEGRETLVGSRPRTLRRRHRVQLHGRAVNAAGSTVSFSDGAELEVGTVVWATGFGVDRSWIDLPVFDDDGRLVHERGVTGAPGLYFLGMSWQHTRGSALLGWVADDAEYIAARIAAFQPPAPVEGTGASARRLAGQATSTGEPT